jgi:toxin YoeB
MPVRFDGQAYLHLVEWSQTDLKILEKIHQLIKDVDRDPFRGLGKPEPLKWIKGCWSRRITDEHRMVYRVADGAIIIVSLKGHY